MGRLMMVRRQSQQPQVQINTGLHAPICGTTAIFRFLARLSLRVLISHPSLNLHPFYDDRDRFADENRATKRVLQCLIGTGMLS